MLAAAATALTVAGYIWSAQGGIEWMVLTNRALAIFAIWLTASILAMAKKADTAHRDLLHELERRVEQRTEALAAANRNLELEMTERKRAEDAQRESERQAKLLMNSVPALISYIDPQKRFRFTNKAYENLFGRSARELRDSPVEAVVGPETYRISSPHIDRALSGHESRFENTVRNAKGEERFIEVSYVPDSDRDGIVKGLFSLVVDITERKEAEKDRQKLQEQLFQAQKIDSLGTLAGGIAHDFNNSLFPIIGLTEMTKARLPEDSTEFDSLAKVLEAAHHAKDLVQQMLAFSRQETPDRRPLELEPVIREALCFLRAGLPSTIKIKHSSAKDLPVVLADPTQIHQILINLGGNARDAMENDGGTLTIRLSTVEVGVGSEFQHGKLEPGRYARLEVSDTGCGMSDQMVERIFDPFFTTREVGKGTGLGLPVVYGIVKNHGGTLTVQSEIDSGSTFTIFFPAFETPESGFVLDGTGLDGEHAHALSES